MRVEEWVMGTAQRAAERVDLPTAIRGAGPFVLYDGKRFIVAWRPSEWVWSLAENTSILTGTGSWVTCHREAGLVDREYQMFVPDRRARWWALSGRWRNGGGRRVRLMRNPANSMKQRIPWIGREE